MRTKLQEIYPDALQAISPHPDSGSTLVGSNEILALCCCTIVLARQLEQVAQAIQNLDIQKA